MDFKLAKKTSQSVKNSLKSSFDTKKLCVTYPKNCIDFNNNVIFSYNKTIHNAINRSQFQLFFVKLGFNNPLSSNIVTEEINNDIVFFDEINSEVLTSNNPDSGYTSASEINKKLEIETEVSKHFEKYNKRIIEIKYSNEIKGNILFTIGS
ncbi:hypothetical protein CWI36_1817p0010 [Hamiltosporidium magnivora]|uniref:Uncharacterized protein n=1 Tax=Hamiltosporidium magnivora TaxID=148818 RepID=A0A4Q9KYU8_9MICR|nr:hypothetical protein CWI36_1817p0010 [Hamiltosporidium magnivora]